MQAFNPKCMHIYVIKYQYSQYNESCNVSDCACVAMYLFNTLRVPPIKFL